MTESHSASVEVDLILLDIEDLHVGQSDNAESLVDLESIDGGDLDLGVLQSLGHSQSGSSGEVGRAVLSITPAKDLADGLQTVLLDSLFRGEDKGGGAIGKRRSVGGGDGTILLEGRAECAGLGLVELGFVSNCLRPGGYSQDK